MKIIFEKKQLLAAAIFFTSVAAQADNTLSATSDSSTADLELTVDEVVLITRTDAGGTVDLGTFDASAAADITVNDAANFCVYTNETSGSVDLTVTSLNGASAPQLNSGAVNIPYTLDLHTASGAGTGVLDGGAATWTAGATSITGMSSVTNTLPCGAANVFVNIFVDQTDMDVAPATYTDTITLLVEPG